MADEKKKKLFFLSMSSREKAKKKKIRHVPKKKRKIKLHSGRSLKLIKARHGRKHKRKEKIKHERKARREKRKQGIKEKIIHKHKGMRKAETRKEDIKKLLEEYKLDVDNAVVNIRIEKGGEGLEYNLYMPELKPGTLALLNEVRKDLISASSIGVSEMTDIKSIAKMKKQFIEQASRLFREKVPNINLETEKFLSGILMQEMLGLGKMEFLINDINLEEIVVINSKEVIRVYHKKYGWLKTNIRIDKEEDINNYSNIIARRVGRQINVLTPLLDAHVVTGDRANAVLFPIATKGNTITIRKFARDPWTIIDLINNNTISLEIVALLWLAVEYEMNILVSGGTASGKTVFLNVLMPFIPPNQRVISIEDTRELNLPDFLYWCPLVTRTPNPEGKGEVSMLDLLVNSLRMRPDRIVLGEMRRQREAEVLFEAMHTGHSVYATVHADTAAETVSRLTNPPINVPANLLKAVNLNVVMFRDRRKGIRRVFQVAEFIPGEEKVTPNILYRWVPDKDVIVKHSNSLTLMEDLSRHTAMSQAEINKELKEKEDILKWMIKNNLRRFDEIGKVMNMYYTNQKLLFDIVRKNAKLE